MNWRSRRFQIAIGIIFIVVLLAGITTFWYINQASDPMAHVTHVFSFNEIPASTASLTTYKDSEYNFVISYPSDWKLNNRAFNSSEFIHFNYQVDTAPDVYPLDITCSPNPQNLTAQKWSDRYPDNTSQGSQTLPNGTSAFVSTGNRQGNFTNYTFVNAQKVCTVSALNANPDNGNLIDQVVNSFQWR